MRASRRQCRHTVVPGPRSCVQTGNGWSDVGGTIHLLTRRRFIVTSDPIRRNRTVPGWRSRPPRLSLDCPAARFSTRSKGNMTTEHVEEITPAADGGFLSLGLDQALVAAVA